MSSGGGGVVYYPSLFKSSSSSITICNACSAPFMGRQAGGWPAGWEEVANNHIMIGAPLEMASVEVVCG